MKIQLRDEKILTGLKNFDLRVIVTGRRLPLVWIPYLVMVVRKIECVKIVEFMGVWENSDLE